MALYAFDGTWNEDKDGTLHDTNVLKFHAAYLVEDAKKPYWKGPGTRGGWFGKIFGGAFGIGGKWRVHEAYKRFLDLYKAGEINVDIIGFSRGAAIALDFANKICKEGARDSSGARVTPKIRFLGLWDTVASFGLNYDVGPLLFHEWNPGWNLKVPPNVEHCYHALAIDEERKSFGPTRNKAKGAHEVWFRGHHSDIGGGNANPKRNNIALRWMLKKAVAVGLPIDAAQLQALDGAIDPNEKLQPPKNPVHDPPRIIAPDDTIHYTVEQCTLPSRAKIPADPPRETPGSEAQAQPLNPIAKAAAG